MKTRILCVISFMMSFVLLLTLVPSRPMTIAAQGPQPPRPSREFPEDPFSPHGGPVHAPDDLWVTPESARPSLEAAGITPLATGGPDDFGYTWDDGMAFSWIDAKSLGVNSGLYGGDVYTGSVNIGFAFKFYGNSHTQLYFSTKGLISFEDGGGWFSNVPIPNPATPNNIIVPFWDDLGMYKGTRPDAGIYTYQGGSAPNRYFVIEWYRADRYSGEGESGDEEYDLTFEVILHENGDVVMQYQSLSGYLESATVGIEDDIGIDGLQYLYNAPGLGDNMAVRFYCPPPSARVQIYPLYQGRFTHAGETATFQQPVHNTGDLGADTYDLTATSSWPVTFYASDGTTPLTDTDSDGIVDTGSVAQDDTVTITVKVQTPAVANVGSHNTAAVTVCSSLNTAKSKTASLQTAIPAPFAQAFGDEADGAMSLHLVQPDFQSLKKATSDWHYGDNMSVAEMPDGFAYLWTRGRSEGSVYVREIEYTLLDHYGQTVRVVSKLSDHSGATVYTYDYEPAVAVAPNGRIGVLWYRYLWNSTTSQYNYNIYFAILDAAGAPAYGPVNVTNNTVWGTWSDYDVPQFRDPRIAATDDNRFVLVWQQEHQESDGWVDDIYYAVLDSSGSTVRDVTRLTNDTPGESAYYAPAVASVSSNRVFLSWVSRQDGNDDIYYAVIESDGSLVKTATDLSVDESVVDWWNYDAIELSNGKILAVWQAWGCHPGEWVPRIRFALLDSSYNRIGNPVCLGRNPAATSGDTSVSAAADTRGHAILTWMDNDYSNRRNLYYALVDGSGNVLTDPMIFRTSQASEPYIFTSYEGYGNTSYRLETVPVVDVPLDIVLVQDETGSMGNDIDILKSLTPDIWDSIAAMSTAGFRMSVVGFRDFARGSWGNSGDWVYRLLQDFTPSRDDYVAGVNALSASGGYDSPESQYATLYYLLTPSHPCIDSNGDGDCLDANDTLVGQQPSFRPVVKRVILLATDAPFHDPEDTSGYPGPSRDTVVNALQASNTTVIGLVPGGAGMIPEVDDLALETGGSVQDTGSSGQDVAEAIAAAIGEFGSVPGSQGSIFLTAFSFYNTAQSIAPSVQVGNPTDAANTYIVIVSLLQGGVTLDSKSRSVTVPGGGSTGVSDINFGTQPPGSYQLVAELWLDTIRISTQRPHNLYVVSGGQLTAIIEGAKLKEAADAELDEITDIVVDRYGDSLTNASGEVVSFLTGKVITWLEPVGKAAGGFSATDIDKAVSRVTKKIFGIKNIAGGFFGDLLQVRRRARQAVETDLAPQRQSVTSRQQVFGTFVAGQGDFSWTDGMAEVASTYRDNIRNRTERKLIPGFLPPPLPIGLTTFDMEDWTFGFYETFSNLLGWLVFFGALVILIVVGLAALGFSIETLGASIAGYIAALPGLIAAMAKGKLVIAAALVIFAVVMHMQAEVWVAPSVTREHGRGLDTLSERIQESFGLSFEDLSTMVSVEGRQVALSTRLTNADTAPARPLVETYLYSVDGRVVEILSWQPTMTAEGTETLRETIAMPPGRYKAVTVVHTRNKIGLAHQVTILEVPSPTVALGVSLDKTQLSLGQAVQATIILTNTSTISETGNLAVLAESGDGQNLKGWLINLAPGSSRRLEHSFVPQAAGSYRLRAFVTDGANLLAAYDTAYVVGNGASLAVNYDSLPVYSPGEEIALSMFVVNSGNQPTATVLSVQAFDLDAAETTPIVEDSHPLSLAPGGSEQWLVTVLPAAQAVPGRYAVRVYLDDVFYRSSEFSIEAEDTLFTEIYGDSVFHTVGDAVTFDVRVRNSVYTYTDATVGVSLWRPDGITQAVTMNSISTGRYQGTVTATINGTYLATVEVSKPNYRAIGNHTFFIAGESSQLQLTVDGRPILGTTRPVTVTVRNEWATPITGVRVVVSGTNEYLSRQTDELGQVVLQLSPAVTDTYQVTLEKLGFARTMMDLPVWIAPDVTPPGLFLDAPSITNHTPLIITGLTEAGAILSINGTGVPVDAQGRFTTTLALNEGENLLTAAATDAVSNTMVITRTVTLDTVPPSLSVTYPPEELNTALEVINVTGSTEADASVRVSDTLPLVDPTSGAFSAWIALQPGINTISIVATDAAENSTTVTRTVNRCTTVQADFTASSTSGIAPFTVVFTNTSTCDYTASLWNFGDGVTSTLENPTHIYTAAGAYTVTLTVSGPGGSATETKAEYITVSAPAMEEYYIYLPLILRH